MSEILYKCMTKAIISDADQVRHSLEWVMSRRGILKVFSDRLECGDWVIPYNEINHAVLTSIRSSLFLPGYVLRVQTDSKTYQFGLNWGRFWKTELPFFITREKGHLGYSKFSVLMRVFLILFLAYWLWKKFA